MHCSKAAGFTFVEAMISMTIIALLALFVVTDLRSSSQQEELVSAQRVLAGDLRSLQSRALTAQNVRACTAAGATVACELSAAVCDAPPTCAAVPPYSDGARFVRGASTYDFFADLDPAHKDWMETVNAGEAFQVRDFALSGAPHVVIMDILVPMAVSEAHVAFERQNGNTHINPCATAPCVETPSITIRLQQTQTGRTKDVTVNAVTGRVSLE